MIYAAILAGGRGERLWPKSRIKTPKHLLPIVGKKTMIQQTVDRLDGFIKKENIYVITDEVQKEIILQQIPDLSPDNVIAEPFGRNTAACVALAATYIVKKNPDVVMISFHSDHVIKEVDIFQRILKDCCTVAEKFDGLVTIGIAPDKPDTGYGYIHVDEQLKCDCKTPFWKVESFKEKPDWETAKRYFESGEYFWNSGIFIWKVSIIFEAMKKYMPELHSGCLEIMEAIGTTQEKKIIEKVYSGLEKIPIDTGVMEKADNVYVAKGEFTWDDVGTWASIENHFDADENGNVVLGAHLGIDTKNCIFVGGDDSLIASIGVSDIIVVRTDDAVLICPKNRAQDVKKLVAKLKDDKKYMKYL